MVLAGHRGDRTSWTELDVVISRAGMQVVDPDAALAIAAQEAFLRFGKGRHPAALDLGECASYALAKSRRQALLFKGEDFLKTDLTAAA